jgi:hypothetical protein
MRPYLVGDMVLMGMPTLYIAMRYRECRQALAGAFLSSGRMQFHFYPARLPIRLFWMNAAQSPQLSAMRRIIHFLLFPVGWYFAWFFRKRPSVQSDARFVSTK